MDVFSWPLQEVAATWALGFDRVLFYEMDAQVVYDMYFANCPNLDLSLISLTVISCYFICTKGSGVFVSQWWPDNVVYQSAKTNSLKFQYLIHCLETALF